jgi:hypothetical protein
MKPQEGSVLAGAGVAAMGAALALLAWLQPQGLRVPQFVVQLGALAFMLAGATAAARARGHRLLVAWLPVPLLACLAVPPVWLAIGGGRRQCGLAGIQGVVRIVGGAGDLACRVGFGIGAIALVAMLLLALRQAIRASRPAAPH